MDLVNQVELKWHQDSMSTISSLSIFILSLLFFLGPTSVQAQTRIRSVSLHGISVQSDHSDQNLEDETADLRGHVHLIYKNQTISCDAARLNFRGRTITALGNVTYTSSQTLIFADRVQIDLDSGTGLILQGLIKSGNILFRGDRFYKLSESEYLSEDSQYTACSNCPKTWSFSGTRIRAELGGYAFIKNATLRVAGLPVFWLPYLIVPLKADRQTGLLPPEFSQSQDGGLTFSEGLFWAINPSQDATFTLQNYEYRGLKTLLNYRYVLSPTSNGEFNSAFLQDRVFSQDRRLSQFHPIESQRDRINRWFVRYEHYYELPNSYVQRMRVNNASDIQYPKDFPLETRNYGDAAMENRLSLTKNLDSRHWSLDTSYYVNLLESDPLSSNAYAVHRAPEIRLSQADRRVFSSPFLFSYDLSFTQFSRSHTLYDDLNLPVPSSGDPVPNRFPTNSCDRPDWDQVPGCTLLHDGTFDAGKDILRTGQRLDGVASLSRPFHLSPSVDLVPRISYREIKYFFPLLSDERNTRRYLKGEVSTRTTFSRIYQSQTSWLPGKIKHEVVPEITASTIPWLSHPYHPFFGARRGDHNELDEAPFSSQENISDSDVNSPYGLQFDYNDRIYDRKIITFSLTNKLIHKKGGENFSDYRKILNWKIAQSFDAYQAERKGAGSQPWTDILSLVNLNLDQVQIYQKANYYPYQNVTNTSSRVRWIPDLIVGDYIEVAHVVAYNITPGQPVDRGTRTEEMAYLLKKNFSLLGFFGKFTYDLNPPPDKISFMERVKSFGYALQIRLPGNCWYLNFIQYQKYGGQNEWKLNFSFSWDGIRTPHIPETLLTELGL